MLQPGTATFNPIEAGFAVYRATTCLPQQAAQDSGLLATGLAGGHRKRLPAAGAVSGAGVRALGRVVVRVQLSASAAAAAYDSARTAYAFTPFGNGVCQTMPLSVRFLTTDDTAELAGLPLYYRNAYDQTAWVTFTTPGAFD